jgi:hypothetical protein
VFFLQLFNYYKYPLDPNLFPTIHFYTVFVTLLPLDIVVMPLETVTRGELTKNFPAAWPGNTRRRPHSKGGWITLESRDTAKDPSHGAAMLKQPWNDSVILKGDIRKSVFWRAEGAKDGEVTEGILCMRKLRSDESIPVGEVFEKPTLRDSFFAHVSNVGGCGEAEFDKPTTFVTDQGRFVLSMESRPVRPPLLEPSIAELYTSTSCMARFERGSVTCSRTRDHFPPVSRIILPVTILN